MARQDYLDDLVDAQSVLRFNLYAQKVLNGGGAGREPGLSVEDQVKLVIADAIVCAGAAQDNLESLYAHVLSVALLKREIVLEDPQLRARERWLIRLRANRLAGEAVVALGGLASAW